MISVNPDFITEEERDTLLNYAKSLTERDLWDKSDPHPQWHNRYVHAGMLSSEHAGFGSEEDLKIQQMLVDIRKRIKNKIVEIRGLGVPLYADTLQLVRWVPGTSQAPHADSENEDGSEHPYAWRDYASVTYLNDDYEGGAIYFPQHDMEVNPAPRTMVTFPGTTEYMHGVREITSGVRYTIASFWTLDQSRADHLPI